LRTYQVEVFDLKDQYGGGMPCLQFEAQSEREAFEVALESLGLCIKIGEPS